MLVGEVMTSPAVTVTEMVTVKEAIVMLDRHDVAAMPVLDATGELVGVVSEADVIREMVVPDARAHEASVRLTRAPFRARVADVMSTHAISVTPDTKLAVAADLLTSSVVKSLPVIERGQVVGVVSRRDIIRMLSRHDSRIETDVDEVLRRSGRDWLVRVEDGVATVEGPIGDAERDVAEGLVRTVAGIIGIRVQPASAG